MHTNRVQEGRPTDSAKEGGNGKTAAEYSSWRPSWTTGALSEEEPCLSPGGVCLDIDVTGGGERETKRNRTPNNY